MRGRLGVLALLKLLLCFSFSLWATELPIHAPQPITRPHQRSIELSISWDEFLNFQMNRGPYAVHYQTVVLEKLSPSFIRSLPGFRSLKNTRLTLSTFEMRSREVLDAVQDLLKEGVSVRIVLDAAYIYPIEMPTEEEWESWGPRQRAYFVKAYDKNKDGEVDLEDINRVNGERRLSLGIFQKLLQLKSKFSNQLEIVHPPPEVVPEREDFNYPRIHHMKTLSIQFRSNARARWQEPVYAWVTSSNFTEAGLNRRVVNVKNYLDGKDPVFDPQSQGHIQFGAEFRASNPESARAVQALIGKLEDWIEAYRNSKSFDTVGPDQFQAPRVVFSDGSSIQAFFTEGLQLDGKETLDPIWVISKILFRKDIQLITYYDTQFVFTHSTVARLLRSVLNFHRPERFAVMVDSSQALEPWSALPALIYAPFRKEAYGVYPSRAIESYEALAPELQWQDNILVYRGGQAIRDLRSDKLHLKARYFEYIDALGVTHYVVLWGSANSSHNASKLSADAYYLFQSTDPKVGELLRPFFESLREDPRMQKYSIAFLERHLFENFTESLALVRSTYLRRWENFLSKRSNRRSLSSLVEVLEKTGPRTQQGKRILKLFNWHLRYNGNIAEFGWEDFEQILRISQDESRFSSDFLEELTARWTSSIARGQSQRGARQALKNILRDRTAPLPSDVPTDALDPKQVAMALIHQNCLRFLSIVVNGKEFQRTRYPIVESNMRKRPRKSLDKNSAKRTR